jgi:phage terminase large subunit GpA-like protein
MKEVPNGSIALVGANSAAALRQTAAKIVLVDELDACPRDVEGEGSPLAIAEARARTFGPSRKVVLVSSPTEKGRSLIEAEFLQSDQRRYEVPCPFCEARQEFTIDGLTWEPDQPETARYLCVHCRKPIDEGRKPAMVTAGTWRATARSDPRRRGYHLSSLYSPSEWFSWADVARAAIAAERDPMAMKPYMNTVLGQCYAERMEQVDWQVLAARQTPLACGVVPPGVFMLTAGIDVQDSELQCHVWGWGAHKRRWLVDVRHLPGRTRTEDAPWDALATLLGQTWPTVDGRHHLGLRVSAIDAGHQADRVYAFARRIGLGRLLVVKGKSSCSTILGVPWRAESLDTTGKRTAARRRRGLVLYPVGTDVAKSEFYAALRVPALPGAPLPAGYVSFPQVGEAVCKELCSEALVRKRVAGREVESWQRVSRPNDALDGAIYARAAAQHASWDRWTAADYAEQEALLGTVAAPADPPTPVAPASAPPPAPASVRVPAPREAAARTITWKRSTFWDRRPRGWGRHDWREV